MQRFASAKALKYLCIKRKPYEGFSITDNNTPAEDIKVDVILKDEDIWASQKAMASLFGIGVPGISKHIKHIFETGELKPEVVISKMETTSAHGAIADKTQDNFIKSCFLYPQNLATI